MCASSTLRALGRRSGFCRPCLLIRISWQQGVPHSARTAQLRSSKNWKGDTRRGEDFQSEDESGGCGPWPPQPSSSLCEDRVDRGMIGPSCREVQFSSRRGRDGALRDPLPRVRRRLLHPPELLPGARVLQRCVPGRGAAEDEAQGEEETPGIRGGAGGSPGRGAGAASAGAGARGGSYFRKFDRDGTPFGRKRGAR